MEFNNGQEDNQGYEPDKLNDLNQGTARTPTLRRYIPDGKGGMRHLSFGDVFEIVRIEGKLFFQVIIEEAFRRPSDSDLPEEQTGASNSDEEI